ncbi:MAG: hypothetical protein E7184_03645 [Erysipelotrichaceae bacterium]|nr:hypothetical protein [Erysipelotrichaceae bacterium]
MKRNDDTQKIFEDFVSYMNPVGYTTGDIIVLSTNNYILDLLIKMDTQKGYNVVEYRKNNKDLKDVSLHRDLKNAISFFQEPFDEFGGTDKVLILSKQPEQLIDYITPIVKWHIEDRNINLNKFLKHKESYIPYLYTKLSINNERVILDKDGYFDSKNSLSICDEYLTAIININRMKK